MLPSSKSIFLALCLLCFVCSEPINVLQAGRLVFSDSLLRKNTCMLRPITLPFDQTYYSNHPDLGAVAVISSVEVDDALALQFYYHIQCDSSRCFLDFRLQRITPEVTSPIPISLKVNYIVGHGIRTASFNMTQGRKSIHAGSFNSHPNSHQDFNLDEWDVAVIPNGFNHVSLTGKINTIVARNSVVVELEQAPREWTLGLNFILYSAVLLPKGYISSPCGKMMQTECQTSQLISFMGARTSSVSFSGSQQSSAQLKLMILPYEESSQMVDLLVMENDSSSKRAYNVERRDEIYFVLLILVMVLFQASYFLYKNYIKQEQQLRRSDAVRKETSNDLRTTDCSNIKEQVVVEDVRHNSGVSRDNLTA